MIIINDADIEIDKDVIIGFTIEEALELRKAIDDILKKKRI